MPKRSEILDEAEALAREGSDLYFALLLDTNDVPEATRKALENQKLPQFRLVYEDWYSKSLRLIRQVLPDRLDDFVLLYRDPRRKEFDALTYTISDYLLRIQSTRGTRIVVGESAAVPKMERQAGIVRAAVASLRSHLVDLEVVLQADLFDSELEAANQLARHGFLRAAGAMAGVVLEKHLHHVALEHGYKSRKKAPSISDFNQHLKKVEAIDTPRWRFIQHLGDLRNLCDHPKDREPTLDDVQELIGGTTKVIKSVF